MTAPMAEIAYRYDPGHPRAMDVYLASALPLGNARADAPCYVAPGFDPVSISTLTSPKPTYWTKSGGYTNQAQSRILRSNNPLLDVVLQTNTDTDTNPGTGGGDGMSVNTGSVMSDTFYLLYR